jgi:hypothetical protein
MHVINMTRTVLLSTESAISVRWLWTSTQVRKISAARHKRSGYKYGDDAGESAAAVKLVTKNRNIQTIRKLVPWELPEEADCVESPR